MNTGPADTRTPHLDLEDLIATVNGQAIDDRGRDHLAHCEHCQAEASRWDLVAGGIRGLAATAPPAARPARPRASARPRRRTVLAAGAAAAAVLLAGAGYAASSALSGPASGAALTAVSGCSALSQVAGTLERVNGSSLVIKAASGQPVTVTTAASTLVNMTGPLLSDITDGASVEVRGATSGGTIAAAFVTVGQPFSAVSPPGFVPVRGTVAAAGPAGFTLVTASGSRIPVTTSRDTLVFIPHARLDQLRPGTAVFALGHAGPHGTLAAQGVTTIAQLPSGAHISVHFRDCSPRAIIAALALAR
jgi:Domain of unknown function (DUF5666)